MVVLFLNNSVYLIIWTSSLQPLILSYSITQKQIKKLNQVNKKSKARNKQYEYLRGFIFCLTMGLNTNQLVNLYHCKVYIFILLNYYCSKNLGIALYYLFVNTQK